MSTLNDSDLFVIERSGTQYQVRSDEMSTLNDTDLFVVEREGVQYKIEAQNVSTGPSGVIEAPVEVLTPVNGSGLNDGEAYNPQSTAITGVFGSGSITVESDEIVSFDTPNITSSVYSNGALDSETTGFPYSMVPGDASVLFKEKGVSTTIIDYLGVTDYTGNVNNIRIFTAATADAAPGDWSNIYGTTSSEVADWGQQVEDRKTGEFILILSCGDTINPRFASVGTIVIPGSPTLTLASDQGLSSFDPGDSVAQDSGYTPETSAITDVATSSSTSVRMYYHTNLPANLADVISGSEVFGGDSVNSGRFLCVVPEDSAKVGDQVWSSNGTAAFQIINNSGQGEGVYDANGNRLGGAGSYGASEWTAFEFGTDVDAVYDIAIPPSAAYTVIYTVSSGTVPTASSPEQTVLTLTDDSDLENFRVGDNAGGDPITVTQFVAGSGDTATVRGKTTTQYRILGADIFTGYTDDSVSIPVSELLRNAAWNMLWWEHLSATSDEATLISSRGPTESGTIAAWKSVLQPDKYYSFTYYGSTTTNPDTEAYGPVGSDIPTPIEVGGSPTILSIGPGNTLSVDGGTWNTGETVTGPTLAAATGTVASTSGSEIVLSASDGRWVTNAGKTVTKSAAYDIALTFADDTELANIIGPATQVNADGSDFDSAETSAITGVADAGISADNLNGATCDLTNLFDGSYSTAVGVYGTVIQQAQTLRVYLPLSAGTHEIAIVTNSGGALNDPSYGGAALLIGGQLKGFLDGTTLTPANVPSGKILNSLTFTLLEDVSYIDLLNPSGSNVSANWYGVYYNDALVSNATVTGKILTLTDDTDLDKFEVGDVVTGPSEDNSTTGPWAGFVEVGSPSGSYNSGTPYTYEAGDIFNGTSISQLAFDRGVLGDTYELTFSKVGGGENFQTYTSNDPNTGFTQVVNNDAGPFTIDQDNITYNRYVLIYATGSGSMLWRITGNARATVTATVVDSTPSASQLTVDGGTWNVGDTVSKSITLATIGTVVSVDGTTLYGSSVTGDGFYVGKYVKGAEVTAEAPSPSEIVFTSMNGGTTAFTGTDATLSGRLWNLESGPSASGPWTTVGDYLDTSVVASQDGATPWATAPALDPNTFYRVKVEYQSENSLPVGSVQNTFRTGDA